MSSGVQTSPTLQDSREDLPQELMRSLLNKGMIFEYEPGDLIAGLGEEGDSIRFLVSGQARVVMVDGEDLEITVDVLGPWDMFGRVWSDSMGSPGSRPIMKAQVPCEVLEISPKALETVFQERPEFGAALVKNLTRHTGILRRRMFDARLKKRALRSLISSQEHIFPDYVIGDYVRRHLSDRVRELADSDGPVLIIGESGVGKEFIAHTLFSQSLRCKEVFLIRDLFRERREILPGEEPEETADSVADLTHKQLLLLFGSEEHGNNGQVRETPGYVDLSEDGTLMFRGVEGLASAVQQQLLECALTGKFRRLGSNAVQTARFRLIATTRLDPASVSSEEHPLIHGLLGRSVHIPPLRNRRREIPVLLEHYVERYRRELCKPRISIPKETFSMLVNYSWPGNDMELASTLKRAILVSDGEVLRPKDIYFDLKKVEDRGKFNLLRFGLVKRVFLSPLFPAILQSAVTPFFLMLLALLFLGPSEPLKNPGALFCWAVGWPILIIGAFVWARFWCSLCPIGTLSRLAQKVVSFNLPFPAILKRRSDFVIAGSVLGVIWFETATDIRNSPLNLGLLLVTMVTSAMIAAILFERQSWCQYLCGLGGMISVAAKASMVELRADQSVCISRCQGNECYVGTDTREGCPFGQSVPRLGTNRLCKICGVCIKNCPHDGINLNWRVPGNEIWEMRRANTGTAFLVIGMMGGLFSEMFAKTAYYAALTQNLPLPPILRFTFAFVAMLLIANVTAVLVSWISHRIYRDSWEENYSRHGAGLIPLALTSFMAYHVYYLIHLGVQLPILFSHYIHPAIFQKLIVTVPVETIHFIQQFLIWMGLVWSLIIMYRLGRASQERLSTAILGAIPHALMAVAVATLMLQGIRFSFYG
jgi:transcriptional regulator with AAA-type ATPase domain/polyferredoxin